MLGRGVLEKRLYTLSEVSVVTITDSQIVNKNEVDLSQGGSGIGSRSKHYGGEPGTGNQVEFDWRQVTLHTG